MGIFQQWLSTVKIGIQKLELSPSWRWRTEGTKWKGWLRPSKFWHNLNEMEETLEDLSPKWPAGTYQLTWRSRWKHLWKSAGPPRIKLWIWRLLRRAFFTGERMEIMQVAFNPCSRCNDEIETVPHLFYGCRDSRTRWNKLQEVITNGPSNLRIPYGLLELIDEAVATQRKGGPLIFILYSVTNSIWQDRNQVLYSQEPQRTPLQLSLEQACAEIEGSISNRQSATRWGQGIKALEGVNDLLKFLAEATRSAQRNAMPDVDNENVESRTSSLPDENPQEHPPDKHFSRNTEIDSSAFRTTPRPTIDRTNDEQESIRAT
ncbi:hypothetical protein R1flu_003035 [Riccia fluitans]|uniref:Reverse transcriptase zinc-binding domain-containing protein n=1 Tax=Riccia fluitans TaxID=41844 RepID=A0ABD1Y7V2_9MARC